MHTDAQKMLTRYNWPGNIRELENAIERAALLAEGHHITSEDLRLGDSAQSPGSKEPSSVVRIPPSGVALEQIERQALIEALAHGQLGAEGRRRAAVDQPAGDELQDQDAEHRAAAPAHAASQRRGLIRERPSRSLPDRTPVTARSHS